MSRISIRLTFTLIVHGVFSQFGDIMAACFNLLNIPIKHFFHQSMLVNNKFFKEETFESYYSTCAASMLFGLMIGFMAIGKLMENIGRKETGVVLRCFLGIVGSASMVLSKLTGRFELYIFGHFLAGVVIALKVVLLIYIAECSPDNQRGLTTMVVNSGGVIFVLLITPFCSPNLLGSEKLWFFVPCLCIILAVLHLSIATFFPQSPKQLYIQKYDEEGTRVALKFYLGDNCNTKEILTQFETERTLESGSFISMLEVLQNNKYRFSFFLVLICSFVPVFSAVNIKSQYLSSMLIAYGLTQTETTTALMFISAVSLPICFVAPFLIEHFGRRKVFVTVTTLCAVEWVGLGTAQMLVDVQSKYYSLCWMFAVSGCIFGQIAVNMGLLILSPLLISDICAHKTTAVISQYTQVLPIIFAVIEVFMFPSLQETFGAKLFFILAGCCLVLACTLYFQMVKAMRLPDDSTLWLTNCEKSCDTIECFIQSKYGSICAEYPVSFILHVGYLFFLLLVSLTTVADD